MVSALINGIILDGSAEMTPVSGKTVVIEDGIITAVTEGPAPAGAAVIDLGGKYLMPGLINLHTHLAASGKPTKPNAKPVNYKKLFDTLSRIKPALRYLESAGLKLAQTELYSGVTTLRAVGGIMAMDGKNRDKINAGRAVGPRILAANTAVSVPGGHFAGSLATEATSPEEAARQVEAIAATKPDLIKLMITGGVMDCEVVGEPGLLKMEPAIVRAAADKAHCFGYQVAAHVESPAGVRVALENGVDTVEHGAKPDGEILRLFKEKNAALVATLSPALPYALFDRADSHCTEEARINGKVVMDGIVECAKACLGEGIPVGLGTDAGCPFITHYDFWRELVYYVKLCGVTPAFALHTATALNAKIARIDHLTGSVKEGLAADFVVTEQNPLEDLTALRSPAMVVVGGRVIASPRIKKNKLTERLLDRELAKL